MTTIIFSMSVFALVGAITPGPVNIIATSSGATFGFLRTIPHVLGATVSYTLIVYLVGTGLHQLLQNVPAFTETLRYLGSAFLLYMAYKIATANSASNSSESSSIPPSFIEGALCQSLNPKAWLVSMSGVSVFVLSQSSTDFYLLAYCLISFVLCFIGVATWAVAGHMIKNYLQRPGRQKRFNQVMGGLLCLTVVSIFING